MLYGFKLLDLRMARAGGGGGILKRIASDTPSETDEKEKEAREERAREGEREGGILKRKEERRKNTAKH